MYNRAKHIDTRICRIREKSESGEVKLYKVARHSLMGELPTLGQQFTTLRYIFSLYLFLYDFGVYILCAISLLSKMMGEWSSIDFLWRQRG
jgi:hypothetical protein